MEFGNFESPTPDNKEEKNNKEKGLSRNPERYKDAEGTGHSTYPLSEALNEETLEKLQKLKEKQQAAEAEAEQASDDDEPDMKKAA
ncbi:MAG: hypothetical protein WD335_00225 [Candidatus Paceibacterota bacterium]